MLPPITTTISLPGGVTQRTTTRTVSVVLLPFIRARKVFFKIEGLLPNMRHRPLFDDVDVSAWCREETFQNVGGLSSDLTVASSSSLTGHPETASNLISDANGVIEGSFFIPNTPSLRFRTGQREFKVRDWSATTDASAISKAFASYTAKGTLENRESRVTTINPPPASVPVRRIDPVAQSFVIERPEGCFITSVDLFLSSADTRVPLQVQIRPMNNGIPTGNPIPGAAKFIAAADVNTSSSPDVNTAGTITNVAFDAPVYLNGNQEYALVVLAESDSYNVWTAVMKEYINGSSSQRIMKQPSMGSFFKSQNGSTWTPDQSRDLMFQLRRAEFTPGSGTANFINLNPSFLDVAAIETVNVATNPTLRIYAKDHGLFASSSVTIAGASDVGGVLQSSINAEHVVVEADQPDSFTIEITGDNSTVAKIVAQSGCYIDRNATYNILYPNVNQMILPATNVDWSAKTTTGQSIAGDETPYIKDSSFGAISVNDNLLYPTPRTVASETNRTNAMSGGTSLDLQASLTTTSNLISPVIDLARLSASLIGNRVDRPASSPLTGYNQPANYVAETDASGGSAAAKQVFRAVTLEQSAVGLKAIFSANKPSDSYVDLYYRVAESGSDSPLSQTDWAKATIDQVIQTDDDPNIFRDHEFTIDSLDSFNTFQFKIVFTSSNTSAAPRVKDFRAIALAT